MNLFQTDWWLTAAAGDSLERAVVSWDGIVVAELPYVRVNTGGLRLLRMPPYTRTMGPILHLPPSKPASIFRQQRRAVAGLVSELPKHDRFQQLLSPNDPTALAFKLAGCRVEQDFTFITTPEKSQDDIWSGMDQKVRNQIRTATKRLEIHSCANWDAFFEISRQEYSASNNRHRYDIMERINSATNQQGCSECVVARFEGGIVAVAILVWDGETLFYWQSARNPQLSLSGANSALIWHAVKLAKSKNLRFDMDGYHSEAQALFALRFGLTPAVRPSVRHMSTLGRFTSYAAEKLGSKLGLLFNPANLQAKGHYE